MIGLVVEVDSNVGWGGGWRVLEGEGASEKVLSRVQKNFKILLTLGRSLAIVAPHTVNTTTKHMRTKVILGLAAMAACAFSATAQSNVYSLNVVGYYNVTVPANQLVAVANQLNTSDNKISSLLPAGPAGALLYKYNGGYTAYAFDDADNVWTPDGNATLNPGEGAFFKSPVATTLTFVGEVLQGSLTNTLPIGALALRSSIVPQAGTATALGIPGEGGDLLYKYAAGFSAYAFDDADMVWTPSEPVLNVGEAFFYKKSPTATQNKWIRNFTVQ